LLKLQTQKSLMLGSMDLDAIARHRHSSNASILSNGSAGSISFDDGYDEDLGIDENAEDDDGAAFSPLMVQMQSSYGPGAGGFLSPWPQNAVGNDGDGFKTPNVDSMSIYAQRMKQSVLSKENNAPTVNADELAQQKKKAEEMERRRVAMSQQSSIEQNVNAHMEHIRMSLMGKMKDSEDAKPIEQTSIRSLGYFISKNGRLRPLSEENQNTETIELTEDMKDGDEKDEDLDDGELLSLSIGASTLEHLKNAIIIYMFDVLLKYYGFKPKQIGKASSRSHRKHKKKQPLLIDYRFKTLLFSANFNRASTVFVIVPPFRGGICYWNLCVDRGIVYGSLLSYIEFALTIDNGQCAVLLLDPQGLDTNDRPYSIFKIYDKFLSKRIQSKKIKKVVFIGALNEGNLISHLLERRGKELKDVVVSCTFLGCDDPYMTKKETAQIYQTTAVNFVNSSRPIGEAEPGTKANGDAFSIPRQSAGIPHFCAMAAFPEATKRIKLALDET